MQNYNPKLRKTLRSGQLRIKIKTSGQHTRTVDFFSAFVASKAKLARCQNVWRAREKSCILQ